MTNPECFRIMEGCVNYTGGRLGRVSSGGAGPEDRPSGSARGQLTRLSALMRPAKVTTWLSAGGGAH